VYHTFFMFRRSLTLSLILPLSLMLLALMVVVSIDRAFARVPEFRLITIGLIGLLVAWIPITLYFMIRRRILSPLRELRQKFQRAGKDRLEGMTQPAARDEISDVVGGYNQMVNALQGERQERQRLERERLLQSQMVALGIQADGLVHELASPLSALSTLAKLAAEGDAESAKLMASETKNLAERMKRFMALFRDRKVAVRPVMLNTLVSDRIHLLNHSQVSFVFDPPADPIEVLSDEVLLAEALDNLLKNAGRHARAKVTVTAERNEGTAVVTVTDDGPGIQAGLVDKLFRPFFTTAEGGHGLGLFVSRLWAQALGGQLDLASPRHPALGGASFRLILPATRVQE